MKRREVLKRVIMATTVVAIVPSCVFDKKKKDAQTTTGDPSLSENQLEILASVCESFIPETDIIGAKSIGAHLFVVKMVDDCYDKDAREAFKMGLEQINEIANERFKKSFMKSSPTQREDILNEISSNKDKYSPALLEFYSITKRHTIQAFMTSEYVMTKVKGYEFVPGRFNGCVDVKKTS